MIIIQLEYDHVLKPPLDDRWIQSVCETILQDNKHDSATITIVFSNDSKLRKLKKEYFGIDICTDTISFNLEEKGDPIEGEVYISLDQVSENADIFEQDYIIECKRVIIHSCLHLLGYNDELPEDKTKMTELEDTYLSRTVTTNQI
jgi:rRNA maturation RNase YbeY